MIRSLAIAGLLAAPLAAADAPAAGPEDLLRFTNGNQIDGRFAGMDPAGTITWTRPDVAAPMPFQRDKIRQIQRWSPAFFDQVASEIDRKSGQYFVCQICGNTVNVVPAPRCPVCRNASTHFRRIEPPA